MTIEIINVGTELLLGEIVNTNAADLQKFCRELGFNVYHQTVVGDNPARFKECLAIAFGRGADCVITTGGLGPTTDDLTKELSAEFLGLPLERLPEEVRKVEEKCRFVSGYDRVPENNFKQADFPVGCYVLENDVGTANGCVMEQGGRMIINLPGPPKELRYMLEHSLRPYLLPRRREILYTRELLTVGLGESAMALRLAEQIDRQQEVTIALYASETSVRVRLACKAADRQAAEQKMAPLLQELEQSLAQWLIPDGNMTEALAAILPPFTVDYQTDFRFRPSFLLSSPTGDRLRITVSLSDHPIGQRLQLRFALGDRTAEYCIPLLKKAELHHPRLEARTVNALYGFLTK